MFYSVLFVIFVIIYFCLDWVFLLVFVVVFDVNFHFESPSFACILKVQVSRAF